MHSTPLRVNKIVAILDAGFLFSRFSDLSVRRSDAPRRWATT
jgi:hypothetical protein